MSKKDYKDFCPNCKKYVEMSRGLESAEKRCVCGYTIIEVWRGGGIYLREES